MAGSDLNGSLTGATKACLCRKKREIKERVFRAEGIRVQYRKHKSQGQHSP